MSSPLLEDDQSEPGVVDPGALQPPIEDIPPVAVMCFFQEVIERIDATVCASLSVYGGRPVYETTVRGVRVAFFYPGLGAPAAVSTMEEMIAHGCRTFLAVGGAGALVPELALGHALVVDRALRDEGTSHHYLSAARFVHAHPAVSNELEAACARAGLDVQRGTTWTTDAIFRETRSRIERRVQEGCTVVEMEAAALFAVAQHRTVQIGQVLYAGDSLATQEWDSRAWTSVTQIREDLFSICLDAASAIIERNSAP